MRTNPIDQAAIGASVRRVLEGRDVPDETLVGALADEMTAQTVGARSPETLSARLDNAGGNTGNSVERGRFPRGRVVYRREQD